MRTMIRVGGIEGTHKVVVGGLGELLLSTVSRRSI